MFLCYVCSTQFTTIALFRSHLLTHLSLGELALPIKCRQETCKSSFTKIYNFLRHLNSFHKIDEDHAEIPPNTASAASSHMNFDDDDADDDDELSGLQSVHSTSSRSCLAALQSEGTAVVAGLRANSSIPYSVIFWYCGCG